MKVDAQTEKGSMFFLAFSKVFLGTELQHLLPSLCTCWDDELLAALLAATNCP